MSDEKRYTERDLILAKREGFVHGRIYTTPCGKYDVLRPQYEQEAARFIPFPKVTRPRVVNDPVKGFGQQWSVRGGRLMYRAWANDATPWRSVDDEVEATPRNCLWPTPERIRLWADLLANPTEEIEG